MPGGLKDLILGLLLAGEGTEAFGKVLKLGRDGCGGSDGGVTGADGVSMQRNESNKDSRYVMLHGIKLTNLLRPVSIADP
jgi:hypothetical protein